MTAPGLNPSELPYWPLHLSRELAAAYVGVSPNLFDQEVKAGKWPKGTRRGPRGKRITWDRRDLDARRLDCGASGGPCLEERNPWDSVLGRPEPSLRP